jgi:hypothetical protein
LIQSLTDVLVGPRTRARDIIAAQRPNRDFEIGFELAPHQRKSADPLQQSSGKPQLATRLRIVCDRSVCFGNFIGKSVQPHPWVRYVSNSRMPAT